MYSLYASNGHVETGAEPAWQQGIRRAVESAIVIGSQNSGTGLSDKAWSAEFDRRQKLKPIR